MIVPAPPAETPPSVALPDGASQGEVTLRAADGGDFKTVLAQDVEHDHEGAVQRARGVVRHLTDERSLAEALNRSERRFERFFEQAPVGIALVDHGGNIVDCNESLRALVDRPDGVPPETALGRPGRGGQPSEGRRGC